MKANELRIGNLIQFTDGAVYKVDMLYNDYIGLKVWQPIPLTEEGLKKLGFVIIETNKGIECFYFGKRYSAFQPARTKVWLLVDGEKGLCEIYYVHQLQNLFFALTGEELKIIH